MADELLNIFTQGSVGAEDVPPPVPVDASERVNWLRQNIPGYIGKSASIDVGVAPGASARAVKDSAAGTYDMTGYLNLKVIVNDYEGRKSRPGTRGTAVSGLSPATASTNTTADTLKIALHGEVAQSVDIGTTASGAAVAAAIQAGVRALTPASARNAQAYAGFTAQYVAPSFATTLAVTLAAGTKVREVTLTSTYGLKKGQYITITDVTSTLESPFTVLVLDIDRATNVVSIPSTTPTNAVEAGATVEVRDDYYRFESGKAGADSSIVFTVGASADVAAALKITAAAGGTSSDGTDANGPQTFTFEAADFSSPAAATAAELAVVLNKTLTGAVASDASGTLRITSDLYGARANVSVVAEGSYAALGYSAAIAVGTENEFTLSLKSPSIALVVPYTIATGALDDIVDHTALVRVENNKLVSLDGTDHSSSGTLGWIVVSNPTVLS